jgi:glycosyltransferase involved in cell wall biosynthesis
MRIAILCPSFGEYGGIGRIATALGNEFRCCGHDVVLVCRPGAAVHGIWSDVPRLEIPMHQLPRRWRHFGRQARLVATLIRTLPRLRRFLAEQRVDVLLMLGISTFAPVALGVSRWVPVVVSLQGGEPDGRFAAHPRVFGQLLARAAAVTACAASLAREARQLSPAVTARLQVIPNGVDVEQFSGGALAESGQPYVLAAGRFTRQKGFDVLLEAAATVEAVRRGRVQILLAGDGAEDASLRQQAARLGLSDGVRFIGPVDAERMRTLYQGACAVAVPSRWEGLPLVCLEAMASGRAVVASRVDGIPDAVVEGKTGLLVPPDDPEALAHALDTLLADPGHAERLGAAGARRAREGFAWPHVAGNYLTVLARAARSRRSS